LELDPFTYSLAYWQARAFYGFQIAMENIHSGIALQLIPSLPFRNV